MPGSGTSRGNDINALPFTETIPPLALAPLAGLAVLACGSLPQTGLANVLIVALYMAPFCYGAAALFVLPILAIWPPLRRPSYPDGLASRFPGDLDDLERVVAHVDAAPGIEAAADGLRPDIVLPSAVRWVRRRLTLVRATLLAVVTLLPDGFCGDARLTAVRTTLHTDHALVTLRAYAAPLLAALPRPLGFGRPAPTSHARRRSRQHRMGADPPGPSD